MTKRGGITEGNQAMAALAEVGVMALMLVLSCTAAYSAVNTAANMVLEGRWPSSVSLAR